MLSCKQVRVVSHGCTASSSQTIFVAFASCDVQNVQTRLFPDVSSPEMHNSRVVFNAVKIREDNRLLSPPGLVLVCFGFGEYIEWTATVIVLL